METSFYSESELCSLGFKKYGKDVQISKKTSIYGASQMVIGNHVRIDDYCVLSGHIELGNYIHIAAFCALFGGSEGIVMKDYSGLSSRVSVYAQSDDYLGKKMTNPTVPMEYRNVTGGRVTLEKHVIIGTGASIMPDLTIGEGSAAGSMSLVNRSLDSWGIYAGIPCRRIRERSRDLLAAEQEMERLLCAEELR